MTMQHDVDNQLMSLGSYSPIEWLLDAGHLQYGDYEAWRMGEFDILEKHIHLPKKELVSNLEKAERFCHKLGLVGEVQPFSGWDQSNTSKDLVISQSPALTALLQKQWTRQEDAPQMDLFMDNPSVVTENILVEALANRHWETAQKYVNKLYQQDPNHAQLHGYEDLVAFGLHTDDPVEDHIDIIDEERTGLEQEIVPLARQLLQQKSRDYLAPAWQRIAQSLEGHPYNVAYPQSHASYAWEQMQSWQQVQHSIIGDESYTHHGELLFRLCLAYYYQRNREQSLIALIQLIDLKASHADSELDDTLENFLNRYPDDNFKSVWQRFMDLEDEQPFSIFPGWLLLNEPGLLHHIESSQADSIKNASFYAALQLLQAKQAKDSDRELSARKALNDINPLLLTLYLKKN
ncbi:hypothetical protein A9Q99_05820 [Gammaproteobacteria bacterium 45_16_T64]|nr:hypothetical protein A9Q99_05820 [Gammaproteobacteria bacterium 45_16_T64]